MRILSVGSMFPPHHFGGAELIWHSAVAHQRNHGHEVRVLTSDLRLADPDPAIAEDPDIDRALRWYWDDHRFPRLGPLERLRIERHAARVFDEHVRDFGPDAVVWWSLGGMPLSLLARPRLHGLGAVGVLLDDWLVYGPRVDGWQRMCRRLGPAARALSQLTGVPAAIDLAAAAEWLFMSDVLRQSALDAGLDVGGCAIVHRGVADEGFSPGGDLDWHGRLLYLGRIDPRKGIETAIRAIALLPGTHLTVAGDGDSAHAAELRALVAELGLESRVEFVRVARTEVPGLLRDADALVFPVLWEEPWGLVPLEAMASGTPVVATGRGGSGEYLRDEHNCLLYSPAGDPGALAARIGELAAAPELRRSLRQGGLATSAELSAESFNDAVLERLEAVAAG